MMSNYFRPDRLEEALSLLKEAPKVIVAGCTDFFPARVGRVVNEDILDLTGIGSLKGIREQADHFSIGPLVTWSELIAAPLPAAFDGLKAAAREVGATQVQNVGTVVGNICNASPAADGVPPLLTLDAVVELTSINGERSVPLGEFIVGNRKTLRALDEIVTGIRIPKRAVGTRSSFRKLGCRRYLVISIVMAAAMLEQDLDGKVTRARVSVGSCSPVAVERHILGAGTAVPLNWA